VLTSGASAAEVAALELEAVRERFRDAIFGRRARVVKGINRTTIRIF
jgi:hypothetical protein